MSAIRDIRPLGFPWPTLDPFLFCAHHRDDYPAGNANLGIDRAQLAGRDIGMDFTVRDGFRMYHGDEVPGFPQHPHRGFETVTLARRGFIDHADSLGAAARFGEGDVQWMTAGSGIVHSEMFPLLDRSDRNPAELFQLWLNLPAARKLVSPEFTVLWSETIPRRTLVDDEGRESEVVVIAGPAFGLTPPRGPGPSYASQEDAEVAIWTLRLSPGATLELPPASAGVNRALYLHEGGPIAVGGTEVAPDHRVVLDDTSAVSLRAGEAGAALLYLAGRPLGEPVAHHGPFVMNTRDELLQAMRDYQRTRFGGWPWPSDAPVHDAHEGRFARHVDGRVERPGDPGADQGG